MGFSDSLKKITKKVTGGTIERGAGAFTGAASGNPFAPFVSDARGAGLFGSDPSTARLVGGILSPSSAATQTILDPRQREKFMDKSKEFFKGKKEDPPALGEAPGSGADTIAAKRQARQRALQAAARRKGLGLSGTVATTPLGLQGDGAAVSQRRLIGE
jgi:hypothetical protein